MRKKKGGVRIFNPYDQETFTDISPKDFEELILEALGSYDTGLKDLRFQHRENMQGLDGIYEIDGTARFNALGVDFLVLIECKHHKSSIKRETVQVLRDRLTSTGAHKGILCSSSNFQKGAIEYARLHGIALIRVTEGGLCYQTRSLEGQKEIPPWLNIPKFIAWRIKGEQTGLIISSWSSKNPDSIGEFLKE